MARTIIYPPSAPGELRATRHGWFGFEGFGRPYESWAKRPGPSGWRSLGRTFTRRGAEVRARAWLSRVEREDER